MKPFKPMLTQCPNNVFMIRNSEGKVYRIQGTFSEIDRKWLWTKSLITDMVTNPRYVIMGTLLHDIPTFVKKEYFSLMKKKLATEK